MVGLSGVTKVSSSSFSALQAENEEELIAGNYDLDGWKAWVADQMRLGGIGSLAGTPQFQISEFHEISRSATYIVDPCGHLHEISRFYFSQKREIH